MNWDIVLQYVLPSALGVVAGLFSPMLALADEVIE